MVHELGEEGVRERAQRLAARASGADEDVLVEKRVEVPKEMYRDKLVEFGVP